MASLHISLFGSIRIWVDGQPVTLAYDKVRALLAILLSESKQPQRRETLAGLLWPEQLEKEARHSLSQALLKLRQAIDPDNSLIVADRHTVGWQASAQIKNDTAVFTTNLQQYQTHRHAQPNLCESCMAQRETAVSLYNGPFLAGLSLPDAPQFEQWLTQQREQYHRQVMDALTTLTTFHEQRAELTQAIHCAQRQLAFEPWREETHYQLMRLLLYKGQRSSAIAQYLTCVQTLADELTVEPSPKTVALFKLIQTAKAHPPHNLPTDATPFVGRQTEITRITSWLAAKNRHLVTIVGPGGMGKTRLALAVAQRQLGRPVDHQGLNATTYAFFTHGVYWVSLVGVETAVALIPTIVEALGFQLENSTDTPLRSAQQQLLDYLRQKRILLLLDNFEQLLTREEAGEATAVLSAILHNAPDVQLLVTSRENLQLQQEQVYHLHGLDYPEIESDTATEYAALALFTRTARRLQPNLQLDHEGQTAAAHVCRLLRGMPLALELAATSTNILSPNEIVAELQQSLELLATSNRDIHPRHRSMQAAFETSWQQLSSQEQRLFAKLSVFRDGFTRQAAQIVTKATMPQLAALTNKSLLQFDPTKKRYLVHELLRQFAAEKLRQEQQGETDVREQHARFYTNFLQEQEPRLKSVHQTESLATIEAELDNIRVAWQWACRQAQLDWINVALNSLGLFFARQSRQQEAQQLFQSSIKMLEGGSSQSLVYPNLWVWKAFFERRLGEIASARQSLKNSLLALEGGASTSVHYETTKAFIMLQRGHLLLGSAAEEAATQYQNCLTLLNHDTEPWYYAETLFGLGQAYHNLGSYEQSKAFWEQCLNLRRGIGEKRGLAETLAALNVNALFQGELKIGERLAHEANQLYQEIGDRASRARGLGDLGIAYVWLGNHEEALSLLEESLHIFKDLGYQAQLPNAYFRLANCQGLLGYFEQAQSSAQTCVELSRVVNDFDSLTGAFIWLGWGAVAEKEFDVAQTYFKNGINLAQDGKHSILEGWLTASRAFVEVELGNNEMAKTLLLKTLRFALDNRDYATLVLTFLGRARLLLAFAESSPTQPICQEEIIILATEIRGFPILKRRFLEGVIEKQMQTFFARLPTAFITAVQTESQAKSPWQIGEELLHTLTV